ncbi:MAG: hypothetical protein JWP97_1193 [Labilithrix sp.]|nr:hypothetical protein [Labilithrix sp.]
MTVLVTGATGSIGSHLLRELGSDVVITSRDPDKARKTVPAVTIVRWDGLSALPAGTLDGVEVIYHLAGEPVAEGRWTDEKKDRIRRSRVDSTRALVDAIGAAATKPKVLVSGSAVGIYGTRGDEVLTETSAPGAGFLADVCVEWEKEALRAESAGVRVACVRTGVVLAREGGALAAMLPVFRSGLAGKLGDGKQWMPWIHMADIVALLLFAARDERVRGPVNGCAPEPVTNRTFTETMGHALHRPTLFTAPAFAMKLAMGEKAQIILASQRATPAEALRQGYAFRFPTLEGALRDLL